MQVPGRDQSCPALPQSVSSQAVLSSIIISLHRKLTAAQLLELEVGSLQAPSERQSQEIAPFVPPQHLPPFSQKQKALFLSDSQKHLPVQSQSHQQHYSSPCDIGERGVPLSWSSPVTLQTCNGSKSWRPRFASQPGSQQHSCPCHSTLLITVLWQFTNLALEGIQKRCGAW